ncbi:hypothetical protein AB0392_13630 [Nonomuraea angiospora]|uniref:hypothetical protein n=1 Tax=Nonomuraea angiospora TaxID=46172 RepID=UPI00344DC2DB
MYLVITNTARRTDWSRIEVRVPVGDGVGDLTPSLPEMKGKYTDNRWGTQAKTQEVNVDPQRDTNVFEVTPKSGGVASFKPGDYLVLTMENVTIAATGGPAVLTVREKTEDDDGEHIRYTSVALVKTAPKEIPAPRDFHPDKGMVGAGENLTLSWEGSPEFDYKILFPGGQKDISSGTRTWTPPDAPKRATTYTLVATDPVTQKQHFLTTTVQVRFPVLETLTATTGIDTPWVQGAVDGKKGRVTFAGTGVEISDNSGGRGTVTADRADVNGVNTGWVQGRSSDDGKITFPKDGLDVRNGSGAWGTVHADKADLNGINTEWVQGRGADDGWISFPKEGLNVRKGAGQSWGSVFADRADLNGVNTGWVQGRSTDDGKITFPKDGLNISQGSGSWGTVHADKADLNGINTEWVQGRSTDDGWIGFSKEGLNVRKGAGQDWGTVSADQADVNGVITKQVRGSGEGKGYIEFLDQDKGVRIFGGVSAGWIRGLNDGEAWIRFNENGIWVLKNQNGKRESANVTCATVNDRPV